MRIITISREFGSGGRELGKRLADALGFDYYDREIIESIAKEQGLDEGYVEKALEEHAWRRVPLTFCRSFSGAAVQSVQTALLLEQKRVIEGIARVGNDCVIVGRNADVILRRENPFHIFVCADMESKIRRCTERAGADEKLSRRELEQNIRRIDKYRASTREMLAGGKWGERSTYQLTVNTTDWRIKELAPAVGDFALCWFRREI